MYTFPVCFKSYGKTHNRRQELYFKPWIVRDSYRFEDVLKKCTYTNKLLENLGVKKNKTKAIVISKNDLNTTGNNFILHFCRKLWLLSYYAGRLSCVLSSSFCTDIVAPQEIPHSLGYTYIYICKHF